MIDKYVAELAREKRLFSDQVRLLQPLNFCAIVGDDQIFIVATNKNAGGIPRQQFIDWSGKQMDMQSALFIAERDLSFEDAFGLVFDRKYIELNVEERDSEAKKTAEKFLTEEILNLERLQKMVRINPIFRARDFLINDNLIFVLSPFSEPFNTIYNDHIKPTVEKILSFECIRADDIYDNKPIMEDIWKSINEAKIIISELTGKNPNVFYETGISHTVGKEVILITQSMDDVPFDLRHLRCIVYDYTPKGIQTLETNLQNTIESIVSRNY